MDNNMELQEIKFSPWVQWRERDKLKSVDNPGIYLLAKFKEFTAGNANPLDENIVYIGETCNNSLKGRWYQFNRSAFQSKDGHSGGWSYNTAFGDEGDDLYVAALPIFDVPEKVEHLFIRYVERKLILDFALKHGLQPKLNHK